MRTSLFWRVFVLDAALLIAGTLVLAFAPITVSAQIAFREAMVLAIGLLIMLVANLLLLRPLFAPLERLARRMADVDVLHARERLPVVSPGEVGALERAFNTMVERLEAERREAGVRAMTAQEEERQRIAGGLHDEVGQTMTGVLLQLKQVAQCATPEQQARLTEAQEAVRASLEEVRRIAAALRPEILDHLGLASALTNLSRTFSQRSGITVRRRLESDLPPLDPTVELVVYRVAQESLTNVARHSGASEVLLSLERSRGTIVLRVADDGRGLNGRHAEGAGLRGIRERSLIVGGRLAIEPSPAGGVEIRLEVPAGRES